MADTPSHSVLLAESPAPPVIAAPLEQISAIELADLRRRAEKYRFLFKTIITVTAIVVGAGLVICLAALVLDG